MRRGIAAPFIEGMRDFSSLELRVRQTNLKTISPISIWESSVRACIL